MKYWVLSTILALVIGCSQNKLVIIDKQSEYQISATNIDIRKPAEVLQTQLEKLSGVTLPITENPTSKSITLEVRSDISENQVGYEVVGEHLKIFGGSQESLLNAVYIFLQQELGVQFLSPDATVYPSSQEVVVSRDLQYAYAPAIETRTVHSQLFYDNPEFADAHRVTYEAFPRYVPGARVHTFHRFLPADEYYDQHPEYYALRNGRRIPTQLCLTHPEVLNIVMDTVSKLLLAHPDRDVISVSQDDNTQYCQCDNCEAIHKREGSPAGSMIEFVNQVARRFPDKQISTLAYQYTRKAPIQIKPEPNVLITLCSIECDRSGAIDEKCEDFAQDLKEWSAISDNIRIWDYTTQFTNFLAPFPNIHTLQPNIQLFQANNARWIFEQHSRQHSSLFELRSYLTAQLLWNPEIDVDATMGEFTNAYYGEGGKFIKEYIDLIQSELIKDSTFFLFLYGDPSQGFETWLSPDNLSRYNQLFDQATDAVAGDEELINRVNRARLEVDYASLEYDRTRLGILDDNGMKALQNRLDRFTTTTQSGNITAMNETRLTVKNYLDDYVLVLNRAKKQNLASGKNVELLTKPKKYANEDPTVLTDGAFGGSSFYANWLGFEGNHAEAIVDLEEQTRISELSTTFLQVTNHVVFFPEKVSFYGSNDGDQFKLIAHINNARPLNKKSKVNDLQEFAIENLNEEYRYIKVVGQNMSKAPIWHHAAGLPSWIFLDEIEVR